MNWKTAPNATLYLPTLNETEADFRIPHDLLARIAYQESSFRADVVDGTECSKAGCKGLMQLNPVYFPHAGLDWKDDVFTAADLLDEQYRRFKDWQLAIAAYNDGGGNVHQYVLRQRELPAETLDYVAQVVADVPVPGSIITGARNG